MCKLSKMSISQIEIRSLVSVKIRILVSVKISLGSTWSLVVSSP